MTGTGAIAATGHEGGWTVDFWLDPACPLTRRTASWVVQVSDEVPLRVRWRVMSLSVLNENRDDDPEDDPHGYLWIPARVAAAVQTEHGSDALGRFYDALWTDPDGAGRDRLGDIRGALRRAGLPTALADVGTTTDHDVALRASHRAGVDRIEAEVGTPVLALTTPTGDQYTCFGPVIDAPLTPAEALRLWEAVVLLSTVPAFRELKA